MRSDSSHFESTVASLCISSHDRNWSKVTLSPAPKRPRRISAECCAPVIGRDVFSRCNVLAKSRLQMQVPLSPWLFVYKVQRNLKVVQLYSVGDWIVRTLPKDFRGSSKGISKINLHASQFCMNLCISIYPIVYNTYVKSYLIFSSIFPLVSTTIPHSSSLKAMPLLVPPQPWYSHSATS